MPQPRISSQSSPSPKRISPPWRRHWMSTSIDGSVKGKKHGRKRIFTCFTSKKALQNSSSTHLRWPIWAVLVDDEPLDLMEHRRVGLVGIAAIGAARADHADRRLLRQHGADLHRRRMGAQQFALAVGLAVEEEGVVHLARRMARREVQLGEIVDRRSRCPGPSAMEKPMSAKIAVSSSITWLIGWMRPVSSALARSGKVTSSVSAGEPRCERRFLQHGAARGERLGRPCPSGALIFAPSVLRSSGDMLPSVASSAEIEPFLPSAATRTASSAASSLGGRRRRQGCRIRGRLRSDMIRFRRIRAAA